MGKSDKLIKEVTRTGKVKITKKPLKGWKKPTSDGPSEGD